VAIKFLRSAALENSVWVARFMREAKAAAMLRSEHAVRVHDVGTLDTGAPYMVMEYVDGIDVGQWLKNNGPMPIAHAAELLLQACEALALAHARGIVHRDIKPSNLLLLQRDDGTPLVKVIDFGISKMVAEAALLSDGEMTQSQSVIGSPYYMAPEQMRSAKHVDARADIWALGATLHRMLTDRYPFTGATMMAIFEKILDGYQGASHLAPGVPAAVDDLLRRCLRNDPRERPETVADFAAALAEFAPARARHLVARVEGIVLRGPRSGSLSSSNLSSSNTSNSNTGPEPDELATLMSVPTSVRVEREAASNSSPAGLLTQEAWTEAAVPRRSNRWWSIAVGLAALGGVIAFLTLREGDTHHNSDVAAHAEPSTWTHAAVEGAPADPAAITSSISSAAVTSSPALSSTALSSTEPTESATPRAMPRARPAPVPNPTPPPKPAPSPKKPDLWDEPF
jgi:serine/threonine-protein kinase